MRFMAMLLLLTAVLSAAGLTPFSGSEISKLIPTELLVLSSAEGGVLASTEDGLSAWGRDIPRALAALGAAASGELFLETVDQVVFCGMPAVAKPLTACGIRPGTAVCTAPAVEDPKAINRYLQAHSGGVTLGKLAENPSVSLPALSPGQSGLYFAQEEGS